MYFIFLTAHSLQASLCELQPDKSLIQDAEFTENYFLFLFADPPEADRESEKE